MVLGSEIGAGLPKALSIRCAAMPVKYSCEKRQSTLRKMPSPTLGGGASAESQGARTRLRSMILRARLRGRRRRALHVLLRECEQAARADDVLCEFVVAVGEFGERDRLAALDALHQAQVG